MVLPRRLPSLVALFLFVHVSGVAQADDVAPARPAPHHHQVPPLPAVALAVRSPQTTEVPPAVEPAGPSQIVAPDDHGPPPAGYTTMLRTRKGYVIAGSLVLGLPYVESALIAAFFASAHSDAARTLLIPVAGPFVTLSQTDYGPAKLFLVGLGTAQIVGAVLLYSSLTTKRRVFVRDDLVHTVSLAPIVAPGTAGMALAGRF